MRTRCFGNKQPPVETRRVRRARNALALLLESRRVTWPRRGEGRAPAAARASTPGPRGAAARELLPCPLHAEQLPLSGLDKDHERRRGLSVMGGPCRRRRVGALGWVAVGRRLWVKSSVGARGREPREHQPGSAAFALLRGCSQVPPSAPRHPLGALAPGRGAAQGGEPVGIPSASAGPRLPRTPMVPYGAHYVAGGGRRLTGRTDPGLGLYRVTADVQGSLNRRLTPASCFRRA